MKEHGTKDDWVDNLANSVIHELMHNKLDALNNSVMDQARLGTIHSIPGGSVSKPSGNSSNTPNKADVTWMRKGIGLSVPQYKGKM